MIHIIDLPKNVQEQIATYLGHELDINKIYYRLLENTIKT